MKYQGRKIERVFNLSTTDTFKKCLNVLAELNYSVVSAEIEFGSIKFQSNASWLDYWLANGNYVYGCSIVKINDHQSKCVIWPEEMVDGVIPLFDTTFHVSERMSKKVLRLMSK